MPIHISSIVVLYKTPLLEIESLKREFQAITTNIQLVDNSENHHGYAEGVNEGVKQAEKDTPDLFIIANPDISIKNIKLESIEGVLQHFDVAGFAMKQNGTIYYGGELDKWRMSGGLITQKPLQRFQECDFVSGSLMVIKKEVIQKIGLFDESYGMYYEDVDYCIRARQAGFKVGIDSQVMYDHFETSDTNPKKKDFLAKNRIKILMKYGTIWQKLYELLRLLKVSLNFLRHVILAKARIHQ